MKYKLFWIFLIFILLVGFNYQQNFDKANIYNEIRPTEVKLQTEEKFSREDGLVNKITFPLWFRRMAYNQPGIVIRNLSKEFLSFWNLEIFFFQEVTPTENKALVIFFWPLIIPFLVGIYKSTIVRDKEIIRWILFWLTIGIVNYMFSSSQENYRWIMAVPITAFIIGSGLKEICKIKWIYLIVLFSWLYGWQAFMKDFSERSDFWLDNRPLVYRFIYENISDIETNKSILVSDLVGNAKNYCKYYLKDKCDGNFNFGSFNLNETKAKKDWIYAGFEGEFLGPQSRNNFIQDSGDLIVNKGFLKIDEMKVRDSIAYGYGELIFVGYKQ